jgi:hypothetical protein
MFESMKARHRKDMNALAGAGNLSLAIIVSYMMGALATTLMMTAVFLRALTDALGKLLSSSSDDCIEEAASFFGSFESEDGT